jgi:hypothetical protein
VKHERINAIKTDKIVMLDAKNSGNFRPKMPTQKDAIRGNNGTARYE